MSVSEPFVTVLTPFLDTDAYLEQCIESVLAQTYSNFEYLLVNNQSTDRSVPIAEAYAAKDSRIRVVHTPTPFSQIENYNFSIGLASPKSAYIKFAQADDWLFPSCLTEMVALAEANPSISLVSSYSLRETQVWGSGLPAKVTFLPGREALRLYFLKSFFLFGSPTTVLYRAKVVEDRSPFYPERSLHPDTEAVFEILLEGNFGFVHQVLSFTRMQDDSITGRVRDFSPNSLDRVIIVKRYGRRCLDEAEYDHVSNDALNWYYDEIAGKCLRSWPGGPSPEFWNYHKDGLATIGEHLDRMRIARTVASILADKAANPGLAFRKLRRTMADLVRTTFAKDE